MDANAERALDEGLHHLYSLDYAQSRDSFRKLIEQEPDNPFGYLFESGAIWWQASQEYGLFKDTPALQGLFEQDVEAALRKADEWSDSKDKLMKADGHFVLGMAYGTRGQWSLMKGHWLKAWGDGKKAVKHLRKCEKLDPDYFDAELGLGVFDYQAAQLSGVMKLGAAVGGMRGDEKRGLERIRTAMEKGRYGSRQAAEFLATIYFLDKSDYASALLVFQRLRAAFPESVYYAVMEAVTREKVGDREGSLEAGRQAFALIEPDPSGYRRKLLSLACGSAGPECLSRKMTQELSGWLDAAIASDQPPAAAVKRGKARRKKAQDPAEKLRAERLSLFTLYRGYAHDILGERAQAQKAYQWVLAHPSFGDDADEATACLARPCDAQAVLARLRELSKGP